MQDAPAESAAVLPPGKQHNMACKRYLECSLDVIIHHLYVGLVDADGTPGQSTSLVDGHILQLRAVIPTLLQNQQYLL